MPHPLAVRFVSACCLFLPVTALAQSEGNPQGKVAPVIRDHGAVTPFPNAKSQPRDNTKIVVDLTQGGPREKLHAGVEKLARFLNIYAGAGKQPASVKLLVVMHGEATLLALDDASYGKAFQTDGNPNLPLIRQLKAAGVEFQVCGQSLTLKGYQPGQTAAEIDVAVSGLTALVNAQQDGYAWLPLH